MHLLAEKIILAHLIKLGLVNDHPIEELVEKRIGAIFFPHGKIKSLKKIGLGHFYGTRVHDVGGYDPEFPKRSEKLGLSRLRTRSYLQKGFCLTVEPGLYIINYTIDKALADEDLAKYLNKTVIDEYREIGGVRLEDDIVITENGCEVLSDVPRTITQIEAACQGLDWK
jgi:Xaa-Pro dipeptidase